MVRVGKITSVYVRDEERRIAVDVSIAPGNEITNLPFSQPIKTAWFVPEGGDIVEVYQTDTGQEAARVPQSIPDYQLPDGLGEGDIAFRLDEDTLVHLDKQPDGTHDVFVTASGDLYLDGTNIYLGDSENAERLATENHTHDGTDSNGDSFTTDPPNSDGLTDTQAE